MSKALVLILFLLSILSVNTNFLRYLQPGSNTNSYDYSSISYVSKDQSLSNADLSSSTSDQSVVYITSSGLTITDSTLTKSSGDSSNTENSEFYGVNAAVLVQGGGVSITGGTINTNAKGANALCATNDGKVTISGTTIKSTGDSSARGLHATYGGSITASDVTISSTGGSCATLATDRGEGTVSCTNCQLSTAGSGSPLIYSTGDITVSKTTGTSTGAQAVVVEGKNTATVKDSSNLKCNGIGNRNNVDQCGVMLYQSQSGDADDGTSVFNCENSNIEIQSGSSVYSSAPMFFITNTDAFIKLNGCTFTYGSGTFLSAKGTSEWGKSGDNGGDVILNLTNQNIVGDFVVDANSDLTINMVNSTITGTINNAKTAEDLSINLDSASKITLTGNSYYTSISNSDKTGSNIINGSYSLSNYDDDDDDDDDIARVPSNGKFIPLSLSLLLILLLI